jgi:hypothetical protein
MMSIGMLFFSRDDRPEYCRISADIDIDEDYDEYLSNVEKLLADLAERGLRVVKIETKPAELLAWCKAHRLEVDSSSRARYASERVSELDEE